MNTYIFRNNKGVALIVVLLIILSVTAIAIISLHTTQTNNKIAQAYTYNRQAAQAAKMSGFYIYEKADDDILTTITEAQLEGIQNAMSIINAGGDHVNDEDIINAVAEASNGAKPFNTSTDNEFRIFAGMAETTPASGEKRFLGDLSKPIKLAGSVGAPTLSPNLVAGFSDGDAFCSYAMHADAYALVGRAVPVRGNGNQKYYLLSDLNARVSGFKREMGLLDAEPLPCHQ